MNQIYNNIGRGYDVTRKADPEIASRLAELLGLRSDGKYLDLACGTGNYTVAVSNFGGEWHAIDSSEQMLSKARSKSAKISWKAGDVENIDIDDAIFDGAMITLAIHHFMDLNSALKEAARVLKSRAPLVILTALPEQLRQYWLNEYFPEMMSKSVLSMPALDEIECGLNEAGLRLELAENFYIGPDLADLFLYSGKQRPELYLSERVRNGISSFHRFCPAPELENGLSRLSSDIDSGNINEVISKYTDEAGDYKYLRAIKES